MDSKQSIPADVIEFLEQKGVASRIAIARRGEAEARRSQIMREIESLVAKSAELVPPAIALLNDAEAGQRAAEAAVVTARKAVNVAREGLAAVDVSYSIERRRAELAKLADPLIRLAINHLLGCLAAVRRGGLVQWTSSEKSWDLTRLIRSECSNIDSVNQVCASLRSAVSELESMLYASCPSDLRGSIARIAEAAEDQCLKLGVRVDRPIDLVVRLELMSCV